MHTFNRDYSQVSSSASESKVSPSLGQLFPTLLTLVERIHLAPPLRTLPFHLFNHERYPECSSWVSLYFPFNQLKNDLKKTIVI